MPLLRFLTVLDAGDDSVPDPQLRMLRSLAFPVDVDDEDNDYADEVMEDNDEVEEDEPSVSNKPPWNG